MFALKLAAARVLACSSDVVTCKVMVKVCGLVFGSMELVYAVPSRNIMMYILCVIYPIRKNVLQL